MKNSRIGFKLIICLVLLICLSVCFIACDDKNDNDETPTPSIFEFRLLSDNTYAVKINREYNEIDSIKTLDIPAEHNGKAVTVLDDHAFFNMRNINNVTVPDSITTVLDEAFGNCEGLTHVTAPSFVFKHLQRIFTHAVVTSGDVTTDDFYNLLAIESITLHSAVNNIGAEVFLNCESLKEITLSSGLKTIGNKAFSGSGLIDIIIPEGVESLGEGAFSNCASLNSVEIKSGITAIKDSTFYGCENLTKLVVPKSVTEIQGLAFYGCDKLADLTLPDGLTKVESLPAAWIQNQPAGAVYAGKTLYCYKGEIPQDAEIQIKDGTVYVNYGVFGDYCERIKSLTLPNCVKHIGENNFNGFAGDLRYKGTVAEWCALKRPEQPGEFTLYIDGAKLSEDLEIPSGVTRIENYAFMGQEIFSVSITGGVKYIGNNAFSRCPWLTSIAIPASVNHIGAYAVAMSYQITEILFDGTVEQWNAIDKDPTWDSGTGAFIIKCKNGDITHEAKN